MNYSQNKEQEHILNYFGEFKGTLVDIGANDGKTLSNSLALIEKEWQAILFEPSPVAFEKLSTLHAKNSNVVCIQKAVGVSAGKFTLHESGAHLPDKSDYALLSTLDEKEKKRWKGIEFNPVEVDVITVKDITKITGIKHFDFITIDAEGLDVEILKQFDLNGTRLICVEWNGNGGVKSEIINHCLVFGLSKVIYQSGENLIMGR